MYSQILLQMWFLLQLNLIHWKPTLDSESYENTEIEKQRKIHAQSFQKVK